MESGNPLSRFHDLTILTFIILDAGDNLLTDYETIIFCGSSASLLFFGVERENGPGYDSFIGRFHCGGSGRLPPDGGGNIDSLRHVRCRRNILS